MADTPLYVVTGASQGIGRAVVVALAGRGFRVVAAGRSMERLQKLSSECDSRVSIVSADFVSQEGVKQLCAAIPDNTAIAGLVHSAGSLVALEPYAQIGTAQLTEHFQIHVSAPIAIYQQLNQTHEIQRLLFIDSYSASTPRTGWGAYSIVKAAAQMAARCAAQELDTLTVRVFPGAVNTQIVESVLASKTETANVFAQMLERGEFAEPADVASFICTLLVDAPDTLLRQQEFFDYNNSEDRKAAEANAGMQ